MGYLTQGGWWQMTDAEGSPLPFALPPGTFDPKTGELLSGGTPTQVAGSAGTSNPAYVDSNNGKQLYGPTTPSSYGLLQDVILPSLPALLPQIAPMLAAAIGIPAPVVSTALGAGGTLAGGGSVQDALTNAATGYATGQALGAVNGAASPSGNPSFWDRATASAGVSDTGYGANTTPAVSDNSIQQAINAVFGPSQAPDMTGTLTNQSSPIAYSSDPFGGGYGNGQTSIGNVDINGGVAAPFPMPDINSPIVPPVTQAATGIPGFDTPGQAVNLNGGGMIDAASGGIGSLLSNRALLGALGGAALGGLGASSGPAGTTTTVQDIPEWLRPYVIGNLNQAGAARDAMTAGGNQATNAAMPAYVDTVNGKYLDPATNPYLDATYKHAAGLVGAGVDSRFTASGRYGSGAHQGVLQEGFGNLATNIFGGNYQAERTRQNAAITGAPAFDTARTGATMAPYTQYSALFPNSRSTTTPYFNNTAGGILSGALAGSALSRMLG